MNNTHLASDPHCDRGSPAIQAAHHHSGNPQRAPSPSIASTWGSAYAPALKGGSIQGTMQVAFMKKKGQGLQAQERRLTRLGEPTKPGFGKSDA